MLPEAVEREFEASLDSTRRIYSRRSASTSASKVETHAGQQRRVARVVIVDGKGVWLYAADDEPYVMFPGGGVEPGEKPEEVRPPFAKRKRRRASTSSCSAGLPTSPTSSAFAVTSSPSASAASPRQWTRTATAPAA